MNYPKLISVKPLENYRLLLTYATSQSRLFDVTPYIIGSWYGQLSETSYFNCVRVVGDTVEWADGQDLAPHELYENSIPINLPLAQ